MKVGDKVRLLEDLNLTLGALGSRIRMKKGEVGKICKSSITSSWYVRFDDGLDNVVLHIFEDEMEVIATARRDKGVKGGDNHDTRKAQIN